MKLEFEGSPLEYAKSMPITELKKKIRAIKASEYDEFNDRCRVCFEHYIAGEMEAASWWSNHAENVR